MFGQFTDRAHDPFGFGADQKDRGVWGEGTAFTAVKRLYVLESCTSCASVKFGLPGHVRHRFHRHTNFAVVNF